MKFFLIFVFLPVLIYGADEDSRNSFMNPADNLFSGAKAVMAAAAEALGYGIQSFKPLQNILMGNCVEPPLKCPNKNITFWYYSNFRMTDESAVEISVNSEDSFNQIERNSNRWKVIIHGYTKSRKEIPNPELRNAYFRHGNYNVLSVDYYPIAEDGCYLQAVHNVPLIALCTAQMIEALSSKGFFSINDLHIIGFSLGGQIAGQIYNHLTSLPDRVTLLDPASPLFDGFINVKADKNAAAFVDAIHTNALLKGEFQTVGQVDFYLNGGVLQPGCLEDTENGHSTCSHNRAPEYFAESINSKTGFWGMPCAGYSKFLSGSCDTTEDKLMLMGECTPHTARGVYYLRTDSKAPYALGKVISEAQFHEMGEEKGMSENK